MFDEIDPEIFLLPQLPPPPLGFDLTLFNEARLLIIESMMIPAELFEDDIHPHELLRQIQASQDARIRLFERWFGPRFP